MNLTVAVSLEAVHTHSVHLKKQAYSHILY